MNNKLINTKWFLYLTDFFAGMSVMAVELGASRLMAPYFSSSQIVWTVIIGVIMIAMAVGNVWGGSMADKSKSPDRLYRRVIIAAIWIALIPFVGRWMIAGISFLLATFITKNFLVWAAFAACLLIFAFPCVLLGTVTPSLTKFTVDNLDDTGKTVGRLNALNTIGSIIGTFVPTFVTIPAVGTAATFLIFSGVLAAIGIAYFIFERKKTVAGCIAVILICALGFGVPSYSFAFWEKDLALEDESIYNYLQVKGAEIDGKIADIAHEYFSLPDSVEVAVADGRAFLSASDELFDVIMVDAYQDITIPFQLSSVEFFSEVSRHLKPEGVMVVNLNMTSRENGSLNEYLCDTMASVFKRTYIADVAGNTNTEVFCTNADTLEQTFDESRAKLTNARYAEMMATVAQRLTEYTGGSNILTDDKAPVELLGMRVLDELIAGELSYYKSNFSMDDIMGMLGA